jgi:uncharacterized protein (DUF1778 family)
MAKRGRPKLDNTQRQVIQVRVAPEVKGSFEKAARLSGLSLSSWMRERLMGAARKDLQNLSPKADITS